MTEKQYNYNPRRSRIAITVIVFGLGTVLASLEAATNQRGMIIEGIIQLGKDAATKLLWGCATFSFILFLLGITLWIRRLVLPRILIVDSKGLFLPHGVLQRHQSRIDFSEVLWIVERRERDRTLLKLGTRLKTYSIAECLLESRSHYDELKELLLAGVPRQAVLRT